MKADGTLETQPTVEAELDELLDRLRVVRERVATRIVGQEGAVEEVLLALLAGGHALLEGVPGLAKTLLVRTISGALELDYRRIQFTPDLMPGDVTGTEVLEEDRSTGRREARFVPGPVFTQMLLADEVNRAPPKTQAALLEAMQEGQVTVAGNAMALPRPFVVLATQNPLEQEGTYPLPEAQLDRFLLMIKVEYPTGADEVEILRRTTGLPLPEVEPALGAAEILRLRDLVRQVPVSDGVLEYAAALVRATRPGEGEGPQEVHRWLRWGAGPRAGQALILTSRARALLHGRLHVSPGDIRAVAPAVLRHRLLLNFHAEAEGRTTDGLVSRLLDAVPAPPGTHG